MFPYYKWEDSPQTLLHIETLFFHWIMEFGFLRNWIPLMVIFYDKIFISFFVESILAISSLLHIPLSPRSSVPFPWRSKSLVGWVMCYIFSLVVVQILTFSKFQVHFIVVQVLSLFTMERCLEKLNIKANAK